MEKFTRITFDPAVMGGKAYIRGLRVTVGTVVGLLAAGRSHEEILKAYPYLEREDIDQALVYGVSKNGKLHWSLHECEASNRHESVTLLGARFSCPLCRDTHNISESQKGVNEP